MVKWNDGANVIWLSLFSSGEVKVYSDGQVEVNSKVKHWQSLLRMYGFLMGPTNLWRVWFGQVYFYLPQTKLGEK